MNFTFDGTGDVASFTFFAHHLTDNETNDPTRRVVQLASHLGGHALRLFLMRFVDEPGDLTPHATFQSVCQALHWKYSNYPFCEMAQEVATSIVYKPGTYLEAFLQRADSHYRTAHIAPALKYEMLRRAVQTDMRVLKFVALRGASHYETLLDDLLEYEMDVLPFQPRRTHSPSTVRHTATTTTPRSVADVSPCAMVRADRADGDPATCRACDDTFTPAGTQSDVRVQHTSRCSSPFTAISAKWKAEAAWGVLTELDNKVKCNFCRNEGHGERNCFRKLVCEHCGVNDHPRSRCWHLYPELAPPNLRDAFDSLKATAKERTDDGDELSSAVL